MKKNKLGKVKMVYDCMLDSVKSDMILTNDFLRYDGTRGVMYSCDEMESLGLNAVYTEYRNIESHIERNIDMNIEGFDKNDSADRNHGMLDDGLINQIAYNYMFPMVSEMSIIAEYQNMDPGGFHILGRVRSIGDHQLQLVVCMMSFRSSLEKNLYLLTAIDRGTISLTYKHLRVKGFDKNNVIGAQNMLQIMN